MSRCAQVEGAGASSCWSLGTQQRACLLMRASNQPTGPSLSVSGFKGMGGCVKHWFHF